MGSFKEVNLFSNRAIATVVNDVTTIDLGDVGAADTFTLTPTRVDTATAGTATGAITWDATNATTASNAQTAIRALGGIYATATVTAGAVETYVITVLGGYDVTWAVTDPTTFTPGSTVETTPGSVTYAQDVGIGKFAEVKKIILKGWNDNSLDVSITDQDAANVFVKTALDTSTASADVPYVKLLTADGVAGEDGAAAANTSGGLFTGPLTFSVATSGPVAGRGLSPARATLVVYQAGAEQGRVVERSFGAKTALSGTLNMNPDIGKIKRIKLLASSDSSVAPTITDDDGLVVYTKSSTSYTTAVLEQLAHEGVDQAANAVADVLDVVAKFPLTLSGSGLGAGTFTVTFWVEV